MVGACIGIVMGVVLVGAAFAVEPATQPADLRPVKDWRLAPLAGWVEGMPGDLARALAARPDVVLTGRGGVTLALRVPATTAGALLTFEPSPSRWRYRAELSLDSTDGRGGAWSPLGEGACVRDQGYRLWKVEVPASAAPCWVRLTVEPDARGEGGPDSAGGAAGADERVRVSELGLYRLAPDGRNDYWVVLGASIQAQSIRQGVFQRMVRERHGHEPVIFNTAVGGWTTTDVLAALPRILAEHPRARFVAIHIGGNNISGGRPYPGGAERLEAELREILQAVRAAGREPILARVSYRAYRGEKPVPPEANGSGPYAEAIYDPLAREFCPLFFDARTGRSVVDAYGHFLSHPEQLSSDGVHVNSEGETAWNRLWAQGAGDVVYQDQQE